MCLSTIHWLVVSNMFFFHNTVWFRFGSVSVSSICYRPCSVHVRFRFLRFLIDFGSVRFGVCNILHWYLLFFRRRKSKYRLLPARGLLLLARGFMSSGFQRAERAELGKPKLPETCMQFIVKKPIFVFFIELKNTTFPISLLGEGKTVPVPPVRFCTRFQRFTFPAVHRLFDFLQFGSTVPVRFQNLTDNRCDNPSHWLIFFKMVKTTNQFNFVWFTLYYVLLSDQVWGITRSRRLGCFMPSWPSRVKGRPGYPKRVSCRVWELSMFDHVGWGVLGWPWIYKF